MNETMTGLTDDQLINYLKTAQATDDERDTLVALTLANTGLCPDELAHLSADWLDGNASQITVPGAQACSCDPCQSRLQRIADARPACERFRDRAGNVQQMVTGTLEEAHTVVLDDQVTDVMTRLAEVQGWQTAVETARDQNPYWRLVKLVGGEAAESLVDDSDGIWWASDPASNRVVPVRDNASRAALINWFRSHDSLGLTSLEIHHRVEDVAERSSLDCHVTPMILRRTFKRRLVDCGFRADEIQMALGKENLEDVVRFMQYRTSRLATAFDEQWEGLTDQ
jgi:integrase